MVDLCADPIRFAAIRRAVSTRAPAVSDLVITNVDEVANATRISSVVRGGLRSRTPLRLSSHHYQRPLL